MRKTTNMASIESSQEARSTGAEAKVCECESESATAANHRGGGRRSLPDDGLTGCGLPRGTCCRAAPNWQMDPDRFSTCVCVMMVCFLGTTRLSSVGHCACPEIPRRNFTLQPEAGNCFNASYRYRYTCIPGFVRKAGTSNLIKCSDHSQWTTTKFPLECIPHPNSTRPPPSNTPVSDGSSITTAAPNLPGTSTSHPTGRTTTTETTSSANMDQRTSGTKSTNTVVPYKTPRPTYSPSNPNNGNSSMNDTHTETSTAADGKTIGISLSVVILLVSMNGIIFFVLYRRRKKPIPPHDTEEMQPMNNPS